MRLPLPADDAHHFLRVLRLDAGATLEVADAARRLWQGTLRVEGKAAALEIGTELPARGEMPVEVRIFQGLPKADKFELIIEKGTEMGASAFTPVLSKRVVKRPEGDQLKSRLERWRRIAREAAMQSGRLVVPEVADPVEMPSLLAPAAPGSLRLMAFEGERRVSLKGVLPPAPPSVIEVFIGPEGGIEPEEVSSLTDAGWLSVSLGPRILRTETAPLYVLAGLSTQYE
jgi:16S rRNA (uracil1498-N3)-methyltransferase